MRVSDIKTEAAEAIGRCANEAILYTRLTRGVELLANEALVDPLIGTFDFTLEESYFVALPRDCKTVLRVNINNAPSFSRSRLFEFTLNTDGTSDAEENALAWADRGYLPIQDEKKLPGALQYKLSNATDNGKTLTAYGKDEAGRDISETLTGDATTPVAGSLEFHKVLCVTREATAYETFLWCNGSNIIAQYYGDETEPEYRIIKLSRNPASVRVIYRKHVFALTTPDDFIPMNSASAVIYAAKAAHLYATGAEDLADKAWLRAVDFLKKEQASRDEGNTLAQQTELPTATDTIMSVLDGIVVGDIYDKAAEIHGPIGRRKILDRITIACEALGNKSHWDARIGWVDVYTADNSDLATYRGDDGHGLFVLPRFVQTPISINICGRPLIPRNKWFEYHINASGELNLAPCRHWDDCGDVCITRPLPLDPDAQANVRRVLPTYVVAVPDSDTDDETAVRIYGLERLADGRDVEVWRQGVLGWLCPCVYGSLDPGTDAPLWTRIERITKEESSGFIKLYTVVVTELSGAAPTGGTFKLTDPDNSLDTADLAYDISAAALETALHAQLPFAFGSCSVAGAAGGPWVITTSEDATADNLALLLDELTPADTEVTIAFAPGAEGFVDFTVTLAAPDITVHSAGIELGYWYPDETEPRYRMIRIGSKTAKRIRVLYRKRAQKFTSLLEPVPLRSVLAIENMLRALKVQESDPQTAELHEAAAKRYLREERINSGPSDAPVLQFDDAAMASVQGYVM